MTTLVGVLAGHHPTDPARVAIHRVYLDAVWQAGGQPLVVPLPTRRPDFVSTLGLLDRCDALLASGGGDIGPGHYHQRPHADLMDVDPDRDGWELFAVGYWLTLGRPLLGICRGLQVLTVATGGTLHQHLPAAGFADHWHPDRAHETVHGVHATPGSLAAMALDGHERVNSIHHQAARTLGAGMTATAWSEDGVVEAVEAADGRPVLGAQWHPERLACPPDPAATDVWHLAAFEWLVQAATSASAAA